MSIEGVPVAGVEQSQNHEESNNIPLSRLAADRLLGLVMNDELVGAVEMALPLLIFIIKKCGDTSSCHLVAREFTERFKIHRNTFHNWSAKLQGAGVISVTGREGADGVVVSLNVETIKPLGVLASARQEMERLAELTSSIKQTNDHLVSVMLSRIEKAKGKVA